MSDLDKAMCDHIEEYHAFNADELRVMVAEHERIILALEGKPVTDIHGDVTYEGCMREDLEELLLHSKNGGIPAKVQITNAQYVGLFSILATFGTAIVYLVIEVLKVS